MRAAFGNGADTTHDVAVVFPFLADGYGACYTLSEKRVKLLISTWAASKLTNGAAFEEQFRKAMVDILAVVDRAQADLRAQASSSSAPSKL